MAKKKSKRVSNEQIKNEVSRLADEMAMANGRQRILIQDLITLKTRQEECPIYRGGRLNDPKVMLLLLGAPVLILQLVNLFK